MHVLGRETEALVTSLDGLFEDAGPAGRIQYSLVRILTDADIEGHYIVWSEVATGRPQALAEVLRHFKPHLIGHDPLNRERIWQTLGSFWYGQKGPALAAVDIALWDIAGKAAALPIYKLLGDSTAGLGTSERVYMGRRVSVRRGWDKESGQGEFARPCFRKPNGR